MSFMSIISDKIRRARSHICELESETILEELNEEHDYQTKPDFPTTGTSTMTTRLIDSKCTVSAYQRASGPIPMACYRFINNRHIKLKPIHLVEPAQEVLSNPRTTTQQLHHL